MAGSAVGAQDTLRVVSAGLGPNGTAVVGIAADSVTKLTGLVVELEFNQGLCNHIGNQRLEPTERVTLGREQVVVDPDESFGCPQSGRVSLALIDLAPRVETGEAVVPAGEGEVARWSFTVSGSDSVAAYSITPHVRAARNGPDTVALEPVNGFLTCAGNCNGDVEVAVNELIVGVNVAGGDRPASDCTPMDTNRDGAVVINELVAAVNNLLNGCVIGR